MDQCAPGPLHKPVLLISHLLCRKKSMCTPRMTLLSIFWNSLLTALPQGSGQRLLAAVPPTLIRLGQRDRMRAGACSRSHLGDRRSSSRGAPRGTSRVTKLSSSVVNQGIVSTAAPCRPAPLPPNQPPTDLCSCLGFPGSQSEWHLSPSNLYKQGSSPSPSPCNSVPIQSLPPEHRAGRTGKQSHRGGGLLSFVSNLVLEACQKPVPSSHPNCEPHSWKRSQPHWGFLLLFSKDKRSFPKGLEP